MSDGDPGSARGIVQDYKSGRTGHSAAEIEKELRLQIPLYMLVLRDLVGIEPLGGLYRPLAGERRPRGLLRAEAKDEVRRRKEERRLRNESLNRDALARMELLCSMAGSHLPLRFIQRLITSAVNLVVHCERLNGGARKVVQVSEIVGLDGETINMHDIFVFEQTGLNDDRSVRGQFRATGIQPRCLSRLEAYGVQLPPQLFERRNLNQDYSDATRSTGE